MEFNLCMFIYVKGNLLKLWEILLIFILFLLNDYIWVRFIVVVCLLLGGGGIYV